MLEGELDASSGCLEGPLSGITKVVEFQAAGCGVQGKFKCSSGAEQKTTGWQAHLTDERAVAEGSSLLKTIAPGTPTPLESRLSSVMLLSRSETSGMPQKSLRAAWLSTATAKLSAASPVMLFDSTL